VASLLQRGALYARTLTHLHPMQVAFRPLHVVRTQALKRLRPLAAVVAGHPVASIRGPVLALEGNLSPSLVGVDAELLRAREALAGGVTLVGQRVTISPPQTDFVLAQAPKLVRYQLNYLGTVRALSVAARTDGFESREAAARLAIAHLREFIERVLPGAGDAWEPYPVAMRILNVIVARELLRPVAAEDDVRFLDEAVPKSLAQHARWLTASLELHLLGNHLFTDGAALFVAGCALSASESEAWRSLGATIIGRSLATDVLSDGGHAERSPMYAAIYLDQLELVIAAAKASGVAPPAGALRAAEMLGRQLQTIAHPDGEIPLFGDAVFDEAPTPRDLAGPLGAGESLRRSLFGSLSSALAEAPADGLVTFPETGLAVVRAADSMLAIDAGPLGAFDQPGHAHSDALTYELSWSGQRLVSDAGAGHYEADAIRAYFRGPLAHSSISVDGQGPDELWGAFRAARRATVSPVIATTHGTLHAIRGSVRSVWGWNHERLFLFAPDQFLAVFDRVTGARGEVVSHVHLAPEIDADFVDGEAHLWMGDRMVRLVRLVGDSWSSQQGEREPFRGFTSRHMGVFEPSTEIALAAAERGDARVTGYAMVFTPESEAKAASGGAELFWAGCRLRVDFDRSGIRWEQL
jgi:uncharacterized heparinase superfamily protein